MAPKKNKHKSGRTVAIIGARGFLGKSALKYLETKRNGSRVIAIDYKKPSLTLKKTKFYKLNLTETMADVSLAKILKQEQVDTLIHTACPRSPLNNEALNHEITAIGSYYIFNACQAAGVKKVVMASTADVYGAFATNPNFLTENMPAKAYRQSKFLADKIDAEKQALKFARKNPDACLTILRPCTILGPTINSYKTRYLGRAVVPTILGFDPLLQFIHEEDAKRVFERLIEEDHPGTFNLSGDGVLPLSRVLDILGRINLRLTQFGFKSMVQLMWMADISPAPASHVDFLRYLCITDNSKIKKTLNFKPEYNTKDTLLSFAGADRLRQIKLTEAG